MKVNEAKNTGHHKIANAGAIALVVFLGASSIIEAIRSGRGAGDSIGFIALVLILLIIVFKSAQNSFNMAFYTSFLLFLYNTVLMIINKESYLYFLPAALCICVINCLYSNFSLTVGYIITQAIAAGVFYATGLPIAGPNMPPVPTAAIGIIFLLFCVLVLVYFIYLCFSLFICNMQTLVI